MPFNTTFTVPDELGCAGDVGLETDVELRLETGVECLRADLGGVDDLELAGEAGGETLLPSGEPGVL